MNAIKALLLVTAITFSSQVSAFTGNPADNLKSASQQIETFLKNSDLFINDEIIVTVKFKLDENDKIVVVSTDSDNYEISEFIRTRLNLKELSIDQESTHGFYYVPVKFLATED